MHQVTVHEAKTHLSRLIKEALSGEEVIIASGKNPKVKIQPLPQAKTFRRFGGAKRAIKNIADDFNAPLTEFSEYSR